MQQTATIQRVVGDEQQEHSHAALVQRPDHELTARTCNHDAPTGGETDA